MRVSKCVAISVSMALWLVTSVVAWARSGDFRWEHSLLGGHTEHVKVDHEGNRIVVSTSSTSSGYYFHIISMDKDGHFNWHQDYTAGDALSMAIDSNNNIIVAGCGVSTGGGWEVVSYSSTGKFNWQNAYREGSALAVAVDSQDNVIVAGYWFNSTNDWKIVSYSPSGVINWERFYDGGYSDAPTDLAVDSNDNIIVVGYRNKGTESTWKVISYSSSGNVNWESEYTANPPVIPDHVAIDSHNNAVVIGEEYVGGNSNWKVVSYSPTGTVNWEQSYDGGYADYVSGVAIDSNDNAIVVGVTYKDNSRDSDWKIISYSPTGTVNWEQSYDGGHGSPGGVFAMGDGASDVAIDVVDNAIVVGHEYNGIGQDWKIISYSSSGAVEWQASYDSEDGKYRVSSMRGEKSRTISTTSAYDDMAMEVCVDESTGDIVVVGDIESRAQSFIIDCEGYALSYVLTPIDVRVIQPAAETPDPAKGKYLGFGDVVANGTHFKVEAAFPKYLKQDGNSTLPVKIFIAAQLPDDYSRLAYFDSSNNMKYQPPDRLSPWKSSVSGAVTKTTVMPEVVVPSPLSTIPSGTHYWYTLVVPATVPDDFSGVDWSTTPWEVTVNVFDVR